VVDDLGPLTRDRSWLDEVQGLLDRRGVVHISPERGITPEDFGRLAVHLGMPAGAGLHRDGVAPPLSAEYPFIADLSLPARPPRTSERAPSYIESLHYDGISAYSMQATLDAAPTTPNLWVDMAAAYRTLPDDLRSLVDTHDALHGYVPRPGTAFADFPALDRSRARRRPLRIEHPRTGDALLYLPRSPASVIDGLPDGEGAAILHELWEHVERLPARYEAYAASNQLFLWDGLGTTHTNPAFPRAHPLTLWFLIVPYGTAPRSLSSMIRSQS
jgi:hypothetical protein